MAGGTGHAVIYSIALFVLQLSQGLVAVQTPPLDVGFGYAIAKVRVAKTGCVARCGPLLMGFFMTRHTGISGGRDTIEGGICDGMQPLRKEGWCGCGVTSDEANRG